MTFNIHLFVFLLSISSVAVEGEEIICQQYSFSQPERLHRITNVRYRKIIVKPNCTSEFGHCYYDLSYDTVQNFTSIQTGCAEEFGYFGDCVKVMNESNATAEVLKNGDVCVVRPNETFIDLSSILCCTNKSTNDRKNPDSREFIPEINYALVPLKNKPNSSLPQGLTCWASTQMLDMEPFEDPYDIILHPHNTWCTTIWSEEYHELKDAAAAIDSHLGDCIARETLGQNETCAWLERFRDVVCCCNEEMCNNVALNPEIDAKVFYDKRINVTTTTTSITITNVTTITTDTATTTTTTITDDKNSNINGTFITTAITTSNNISNIQGTMTTTSTKNNTTTSNSIFECANSENGWKIEKWQRNVVITAISFIVVFIAGTILYISILGIRSRGIHYFIPSHPIPPRECDVPTVTIELCDTVYDTNINF